MHVCVCVSVTHMSKRPRFRLEIIEGSKGGFGTSRGAQKGTFEVRFLEGPHEEENIPHN